MSQVLPLHDSDPKADIETYYIKNKDASLDPMGLSIENPAKVWRRLDWHILPFVSLIFLFSFLDRGNIGNAKIAGMETDLKLVGLRYNTAAAIFFIPYCFAQIPSNILLKLYQPSRWISTIMAAWGLIMTLMCLVTTYRGLLVTRFFLGFTEAGLSPGVLFYISSWYPRTELAKRLAIFTSAATLAGSFSGLLAFAIKKMEGLGGLRGWQWIFCLEGLATMLTAFAAPFFLYNRVETTSFLTETEKCYLIEVLKIDSRGLSTNFKFQFVLQALKDYKIYIQFGIYLGFVIPGYTIALFTPTIIKDLGFSVTNSQLLSIPPYAGGCICTILVATYSDKYRIRGPFVIGGAFVALVGYIMLYMQTSPGASLAGVVLATMGISSASPLSLAWATANAGGEVKRSVAVAMVNGLGSLGGICSAFIFFDPPRFRVAIAINMALLCLVKLLALIAMWNYNSINKQKDRVCREHGITDDQMDDFRDDGDDSPLFRYMM